MADSYLLPIKTAALVFPLLAVLLFVPAGIMLYRSHGVLTGWRALSFNSFLYYLLTAFCMTIVPLPGLSVDVCATYSRLAQGQLVPGNTFADVWQEAHHRVTLDALLLHNPAVWGSVLNVLLLLPLGGYLRYYFRRGLASTLGIGFGMSLFLELTQFTGDWGLYPCPYRLFDVDDLLCNTTGAALGWVAAGPLSRWLPTLEVLDDRSLARRLVPFGRRLLALLLDLAGVAGATGFAALVLVVAGEYAAALWVPPIACLAWFVAVPSLTGTTPGKWVLLLKLVDARGKRPPPWRLLIRAVVLSIPFLPAAMIAAVTIPYLPRLASVAEAVPDASIIIANESAGRPREILAILLVVGLAGSLLAVYALVARWHPDGLGIPDLVSGVRNEALPHRRMRRAAAAVPDARAAGDLIDHRRPAG